MVAAMLVGLSGKLIDSQHEQQKARNTRISAGNQHARNQRLALLPEMDAQRDALLKRLSVITDIQKGRNRILPAC